MASFWIDTKKDRLWTESGEIGIAPKPLALLRELVERPGEIVTRAELEQAVWPNIRVTDGVLRYTIRQVRQALEDSVEDPRFVATVPRRGWRLVARVKTGETPHTKGLEPAGTATDTGPSDTTRDPVLGRDEELARLGRALENARDGIPNLVWITGEAGIGKTSLLQTFLGRCALQPDLFVGSGECVQHYGSEEPYLPAVEALERLIPSMGDEAATALLRRFAPAWLAQLPGLTPPEEFVQLAPAAIGTTSARMLRQFARFVEEASRERVLVLAFDDVHWSDAASLELLAFLVHRPRPLRLLLLATLRPAEVAARPTPLATIKRDLEIHHRSDEIRLDGLSTSAVDEYLVRRFGPATGDDDRRKLGAFVHRWTEGNPLFLVSAIDQLVAQGAIRRDTAGVALDTPDRFREAPTTVRRLIEQELDRVAPEQRGILETASIAGMEFSAATVAAGANIDPETVEGFCEELCRSGRFLRGTGVETWPDGTRASQYRFGHALYREILAEGLSAARRARMHRDIGLRREAAWGADVGAIAGELAHHFDHAGDGDRALRYFAAAGDGAARRYANREAASYFRRAVRLLHGQPETPERDSTELVIRLAACSPLAATEGYASTDLADNLERVQELVDVERASADYLPLLLALWSLRIVRSDLPAARAIGHRLLEIAPQAVHAVAPLQAHRVMGHTLFFSGELADARQHLDAALASYPIDQHQPLDYSFGDDPVVLALSYSAWLLWFQGFADQALAAAERAVATAKGLEHPPSQAFAMSYRAILHQLRRDVPRALATADELITLAEEEVLPLWWSLGRIVRGWAWAQSGRPEDGAQELRTGVREWEATGSDLGRPHFLSLLAEVVGVHGRPDEALSLLETAGEVIQRTGQYVFEPERWRIEGVVRSAAGQPGAGRCHRRALSAARRRGAAALELRALVRLARLPRASGNVRTSLGELRARLTEGADTEDVREADAVLARDR